jgi:hypothetical protein
VIGADGDAAMGQLVQGRSLRCALLVAGCFLKNAAIGAARQSRAQTPIVAWTGGRTDMGTPEVKIRSTSRLMIEAPDMLKPRPTARIHPCTGNSG